MTEKQNIPSATHDHALSALARGRRELSFTIEAASKGDRLALDGECVYYMVAMQSMDGVPTGATAWCLLAHWLSADDLRECAGLGIKFETRHPR